MPELATSLILFFNYSIKNLDMKKIKLLCATTLIMMSISTAQAFDTLAYLGTAWDTYANAATVNDDARYATTMTLNMRYGDGSTLSGLDPVNYANDVWLGANSTLQDIQAELGYWGLDATVSYIDDFTVLHSGDIIRVPDGTGGWLFITVMSVEARQDWSGQKYGRVYDPSWGESLVGVFYDTWFTGNYYVKLL